MPLLEIGHGRTKIADRFDFLKINGADEEDDESALEPKILIQPAGNTQVNQDLYVETQDLTPVLVLKTTTDNGKKLFVNVTTFASPAHPLIKLLLPSQPGYIPEVWLSAITESTDKKGDLCQVLTALPLLRLTQGYNDTDLQHILQTMRSIGVPITDATKWSVPKMKRKDDLARIKVPHEPPQQGKNFVGKPLIAEVEKSPAVVQTASRAQPLSHSTLAGPLPTMYTHEYSRELSTKQSWSVYFDATDKTLKVLIPPSEEFITIPVKSDDFRAFSRDGALHIFCIGT